MAGVVLSLFISSTFFKALNSSVCRVKSKSVICFMEYIIRKNFNDIRVPTIALKCSFAMLKIVKT